MALQNSRWCWMVVVGSHLAQSLSVGASSVLGIMLNAWVEYFDVPVTEISNIIAITPSVVGIAGLATGVLCGRVGYRTIAVCGGVITSLGMIATSFAQNTTQLYIFFGIMTSTGIGLSYTSSIMVLGTYFTDDRLVLANGISFTGISTGQFVLPPLLTYFYAQYGWRGGTLLLGGLKLNLIVCGVIFRRNIPKSSENITNKQSKTKNKTIERKSIVQNKESTMKKSAKVMCRNVPYLIVLLVVFLIAVTQFGGFVFIIPRAMDVGITPLKASLLVTLSAVSGAFGSLGHGVLIKRKYLTQQTIFILSSAVCAISLLLNPLSDLFVFLIVDMCAYSLAIGVITALIINPIPRLLVEWSTPSLVDPAIGLVIFVSALGQTGGMVLAGFLHEITGSYTVPYLTFGAIMSLATVVFLPILKPMRKIEAKIRKGNNEDDASLESFL